MRRGGPDAALSVWVVEQQEVTEGALAFQSLLFLRHPDIQSDVWATPPCWICQFEDFGLPPMNNWKPFLKVACISILCAISSYMVVYFLLVRATFGIAVGIGPWRCVPEYHTSLESAKWFFDPIHQVDRKVRPHYWRDFTSGEDMAKRVFTEWKDLTEGGDGRVIRNP